MRVEFEGGPADGKREDVPDDVSMIFLTDIGPAGGGSDPFGGKSLGRITYEITDKTKDDGAIVFRYVESKPPD